MSFGVVCRIGGERFKVVLQVMGSEPFDTHRPRRVAHQRSDMATAARVFGAEATPELARSSGNKNGHSVLHSVRRRQRVGRRWPLGRAVPPMVIVGATETCARAGSEVAFGPEAEWASALGSADPVRRSADRGAL